MKLKVEREQLMGGLQKVQSVVTSRSTLPVLANILFRAEEGRLWLTASDLDLSVRVSVPAEIGKEGATTLPAKRAVSIFRETPGSEVEIDLSDRDVASIRSGSAFFRLNGISAEDFPPLPAFEAAHAYTLEQPVLRAMLQRTGYAASTDETRQILNGVLLSFRDDKLTVVATDGRRLALVEQELEFPKEAETDLVLPTKTVNEIIRLMADEGTVRVRATTNQAAFEAGDTIVVSKLIEGSYPNYRTVIPGECEGRIPLERELLQNAVRRVALLTSEQSSSIKMTFGGNRLDITAASPDIGEARETLAIKYSGKEISVSFNPEFVTDPLRALVVDEVYFELTDDVSPAVLKTDDPFLYVLMPMRVS